MDVIFWWFLDVSEMENKRIVALAIDDSEHAENALKCKSFIAVYINKIRQYGHC